MKYFVRKNKTLDLQHVFVRREREKNNQERKTTATATPNIVIIELIAKPIAPDELPPVADGPELEPVFDGEPALRELLAPDLEVLMPDEAGTPVFAA
jgi:hypothetical protein